MIDIEFFISIGFSKPSTYTIEYIVVLLGEMTIILNFVFLGILFILNYIINFCSVNVSPYIIYLKENKKLVINILMFIFITIIIIYLLIPFSEYIYESEILTEIFFIIDLLEFSENQWHWFYEYNDSIEIKYLDFTISNKILLDSILEQEATYKRLLHINKIMIISINNNLLNHINDLINYIVIFLNKFYGYDLNYMVATYVENNNIIQTEDLEKVDILYTKKTTSIIQNTAEVITHNSKYATNAFISSTLANNLAEHTINFKNATFHFKKDLLLLYQDEKFKTTGIFPPHIMENFKHLSNNLYFSRKFLYSNLNSRDINLIHGKNMALTSVIELLPYSVNAEINSYIDAQYKQSGLIESINDYKLSIYSLKKLSEEEIAQILKNFKADFVIDSGDNVCLLSQYTGCNKIKAIGSHVHAQSGANMVIFTRSDSYFSKECDIEIRNRFLSNNSYISLPYEFSPETLKKMHELYSKYYFYYFRDVTAFNNFSASNNIYYLLTQDKNGILLETISNQLKEKNFVNYVDKNNIKKGLVEFMIEKLNKQQKIELFKK